MSNNSIIKQRRLRLTPDQQLVMVEFLEKHPDLVYGRTRENAKILWHVLAKKLNAVEGGVKKTSGSWVKSWKDKKHSLKRLMMNHKMKRKKGVLANHMKWSAIDLRILKLMQQAGDLIIDNIDLGFIENMVRSSIIESQMPITKNEEDSDKESLPSNASPPTLPEGENTNDRLENIVYSDTVNVQTNDREKLDHLRKQSHEEDPLKTEWSRVASIEEQRIQIDQKNCNARQDTSEALKQCARAIESLAGAMKYQGSLISEALRAQGDAIAEALKAQGKMIAEALAKR